MSQHILYFSDKCSDTAPFVAELEKQGIQYEAVNITDSIANLKRFLALRDTRLEFEERKRWGFVGIPVLHPARTARRAHPHRRARATRAG